MKGVLENLPEPTRIQVPKQSEFCTAEEIAEGVESVAKEIGASLNVYSDEAKKEREEIYKQSLEVFKSIPSAEERLKKTAEQLMGGELMEYLNAMCDHYDKNMREAAKAHLDSLNI